MANTTTNIAGIDLPSYIFNASGPKDALLEELEVLGESGAGAIMMKTCTPEHRDGNEEPRYVDVDLGSINSMGLPNLGYQKYVEFSTELKRYGKPVVASLAGMQPSDFPMLVEAFQQSDVDWIEINLSCPNIKGKPQIGYDFQGSDEVLKSVCGLGDKPIGVKLPPYFDFVHFELMAEVLSKHDVSFVTCVNSIGNALIVDPDKEEVVIRPKGGFGGLGGKYIKPTALANTRKFYELLGDKVQVIGVGGIYTGTDAFEFLLAGATAVQVGTVFMQEGPGCFARIEQELSDLLDSKGYASIEDARGKLKTL